MAVKMTAYRIGDDTPSVKSLVKAAEGGKQVACVIEIKARFDEERNLHWAAELERAGAHMTFGREQKSRFLVHVEFLENHGILLCFNVWRRRAPPSSVRLAERSERRADFGRK
jgi:hypothetical protein